MGPHGYGQVTYCCTTAAERSTSPVMISRSRSGPTAAAMSIEWTTSANRTVTCLYSAGVPGIPIGDPHSLQNLAVALTLVPHVRHAVAAAQRGVTPFAKDGIATPSAHPQLVTLDRRKLAIAYRSADALSRIDPHPRQTGVVF
jgi:hypothetical protein